MNFTRIGDMPSTRVLNRCTLKRSPHTCTLIFLPNFLPYIEETEYLNFSGEKFKYLT